MGSEENSGVLHSVVTGDQEFFVALAAISPCLAGVCCHRMRLCGSSWCVAVSEPWRKIHALTDGQHVPAVSLPCFVGWEAVAAKDEGAVFGAACWSSWGDWGFWGVAAQLGDHRPSLCLIEVRITESLRLEETTGVHLVQPP